MFDVQDDKASDAGSAAKRSKKTSKSSLEKAAEELNRLLLRLDIDLLNAASTLEDECNKVLVVRDEDMITKNVTQTDKFCCGSMVVFLEAGSFSGKGSYSQAPSLWPLFFFGLSRAPRLLRMWRTGRSGNRPGHFKSNEPSYAWSQERCTAAWFCEWLRANGLGEKQPWKDVLVGREVLKGPVAQGDRVGRNADEECTGCPGNGAGTEVSDCGCSGKDEGIGCLGDAAHDQSTV